MVIASLLRKYGLKDFWEFYVEIEFLSLRLDLKSKKSKIAVEINESLSRHFEKYNQSMCIRCVPESIKADQK